MRFVKEEFTPSMLNHTSNMNKVTLAPNGKVNIIGQH